MNKLRRLPRKRFTWVGDFRTFINTVVKRLRMCELSFELRFFFRTYKVVLKPFYCFSNKKLRSTKLNVTCLHIRVKL